MREIILSELSTIIKTISGIDTAKIDTNTDFLMLGLDSLIIVRIGQNVQKRFGIELKVSQFYEEASSFNKLAAYLDQQLPEDWKSEERSQEPRVKDSDKDPEGFKDLQGLSPNSVLEKIMSQQMQAMSHLMTHQLEVLKGAGRGSNQNVPAWSGLTDSDPHTRFRLRSTAVPAPLNRGSGSAQPQVELPQPRVELPQPQVELPQPRIERSRNPREHGGGIRKQDDKNLKIRAMKFEADDLTPQQQDFLNRFIPRYVARTKKSRDLTQQNRAVLSDWIASLSFRLTLKELKYPITASRSSGSKIWDLDGNEYIDIAVGYGVSFFGNRAPFITDAIEAQLKEGFELGPQTPLAGEVAQLISELTGVERAAFCNTGSEAVMAALRVARAVTGRKKVVQFIGSYHGIFDGVLIEPDEDSNYARPSSPGTPPGMAEDMMILPYGISESLKTIEAHAHELAAVLVEPVQSRRPGFQPGEFLHELRELTLRHGVCLIFDEMITGFRIAPGGAQAHFGIKADLVTYGKIVGGGMPIGVIAGKTEYMDALDGGMWQFGDESYPPKQVTAFAGTFCKHPLTMAASRAALRYMKEQGPRLQEQVNQRTAYFCRTLNEFFEKENVLLRIEHFGSLFKFESFGKYHLLLEPIEMNLFFYLLLERGVYTWERHICFLSAAHTDEDVEYVIRAVRESILEMKENGFWGVSVQKNSDQLSVNSEKKKLITDNCSMTYPMSSGQARLFFLDELDGGMNSYRITLAFQIKGKLDYQRLEQAFAELIRRHDALRTSFEVQDGELIQQVHGQVEFNIHYTEIPEDKIDELIKEFQQPFDLGKAPLFRVCLAKTLKVSETLRVLPESYLMILDTHHIAIDGMSLGIVVREITRLYEGERLPPLPKTYGDFVLWHQEQLQSGKIKAQETYWLEKFSDEIPVLNLPLDYPRPLTRLPHGDILYSHLSKEKTEQLKSLARESGVTLTMILLGAFNVLLHRLTNQDDIIVGMPVGGRPADFENVPGMFANTIVLRNQPKAEQRFSDFLNVLKRNALKDYDHQDYPFELLVDKLNLERDMSRNALFDAMFTYERADDRVFRIKDLTFTPYEVKVDTSMIDLDLETIEQEGIILLTLAYSTDIFKRETISRWLGYYEKIIEEILRNPNQQISEIDMLSEDEKHRLIVEFNDTNADFPKDKTVVDLFEEQVKKTPDNVAVIYPFADSSQRLESTAFKGFEGLQSLTSGVQDSLAKNLQDITTGVQDSLAKNLQGLTGSIAKNLQSLTSEIQDSIAKNMQGLNDVRLTYKELNEKADQIADYLRSEYQIQPDDRVGLLLDRSEQMVVGVLGIMKSGGAYVPIDMLYPPDRIRHILNDSNCKVILTENSAKNANITNDLNIPVVDIREVYAGRVSESVTRHREQPPANSLAYVIYTSGSTGLPKGVMVEHRNLVNLAYASRKAYGLDMFDVRLLQLASLSFDVFTGDMVRSLLNGGQMIICPTETRTDLVALYHLIARYHVTIFESTQALVLPLTDYIAENRLDITWLKVLLIGSDTLRTEDYKKLAELLRETGTRILNSFGITETTVDSSCFEDPEPDNLTSALTPIGRPLLQNICFYVLDQYRHLQPLGVPGELYIGGAGVARGYLNNDALTAERFVPNPFRKSEAQSTALESDRMYKTGDIARWLSNGNIEYFGRMDNQVQIRGYRIEPEEIEKQILKHEKVKETVVLAREIKEDSTDLIAYIVSDSNEISVSELRACLSQFLPDYMIPGYFVFLKELPLTPNAKIDRNALPIPDKAERSLSTSYEPPRTDLEKRFAQIWEAVLDRERIGIHDNFFELGGHSIKAIRMVSKIQTELDMAVRLQDIFKTPTIAELAVRSEKRDVTIPKPIKPLPKQPYYDLSNAQKRLWLIDQMDKDAVINNMHVAYQMEGDLNISALEKAVKKIIRHYEVLRTVFINVEGEPKQKVLDDVEFHIEQTDLSYEEKPEDRARDIYMKEADTRFDLEKAPLFRMKLLRLSSSYVFIFNAHHLIFDGWTYDILMEKISSLYRAYCKGEKPELPRLQIHYKDYAAWINALVVSDVMKPHREYWMNKFSGELPVLDFPLDFPRPPVQRFKGRYARFAIDRGLSEELKRFSSRQGATLFMTLAGAVNVLLYVHTSQDDIVVGLPAAGRIHPDLENQVGFFLNMLSLRIRFDRTDTLKSLLEKVKIEASESYGHEIYPYDVLVEDLNLPKNTARNHLFDVMLNISDFKRHMELHNLKITDFEEDSTTSRADLDFMFETDPQLEMMIEYDTDLFKPETIQKIGTHLIRILAIFTENQDMTLAEIKESFVSHEAKKEQDDFLREAMEIGEAF